LSIKDKYINTECLTPLVNSECLTPLLCFSVCFLCWYLMVCEMEGLLIVGEQSYISKIRSNKMAHLVVKSFEVICHTLMWLHVLMYPNDSKSSIVKSILFHRYCTCLTWWLGLGGIFVPLNSPIFQCVCLCYSYQNLCNGSQIENPKKWITGN